MEKKQTAVQWLINHWTKLQKDGEKMTWQQIIHITNLSLEMEREQIEEAFRDGQALHAMGCETRAPQYYKKAFKP